MGSQLTQEEKETREKVWLILLLGKSLFHERKHENETHILPKFLSPIHDPSQNIHIEVIVKFHGFRMMKRKCIELSKPKTLKISKPR